MKDRYNAALKDVGATCSLDVLSSICVWLDLLVATGCCFVFYQYLHAPS